MASIFAARLGTSGGMRGFSARILRREQRPGGLPPVLASSGTLEARLAETKKDIRRAQRLRYRAFFEDGGAIPGPIARFTGRDICRFDAVCDHLIVVDRQTQSRDGSPKLVGVYRLLRQEVAERNFGFYSAGEFEVGPLIARRPPTRFLEVGRACIASTHRGRRVLDLLWRGVWIYARHYLIDAVIGCASLPGVEAARHAATIRMLADSRADPSWRVAARPGRAYGVLLAAPARVPDPRSVVRSLPPLVRGYWRLGATFSPVPAVDPVFGTTDLFVAMPLCDIEPRFLQYFGVEAIVRTLAA